MTLHRIHLTLASAALLVGSTLLAPAATSGMPASDRPPRTRHSGSTESAQVVLDWERVSFATVYPATPIPSGVPVLGFTSLAMHRAATSSAERSDSSETAAVATAAHDVLLHYYPGAAAALDAQLVTSLAAVPDGRAEDRGAALGERAAARMVASRAGDGFGDTEIHYTLPPGIGTWQPTPPATDMLGAWIGSLEPLVLHKLAPVDGPDALTSADYTTDYNEVKLLGSITSTTRTQAQSDTALFFNSNSATTVGDALVRYLESHPASITDTTWIFAAMHGAMTDSVIRCWQLKRDVGFWRPFQAVAGAADDGNPDTQPEAGWEPFLPKPNYSDYVSGHACLTGPAVEVVRETLGETTPLELRSVNMPNAPRTYATLTALEYDALNARIWGGFHFRDAVTDGYAIGHWTARKVMERLR